METLVDPAAVTQRLKDIAPLMDRLLHVQVVGDGCWTLGFDDDIDVVMQWTAEPARIVMSAMVGQPLPERASEVHATALSFAALWQQTGGARIARGGSEGNLLLINELQCQSSGCWDMLPSLEHFWRVAGWWKDYVAASDVPDTAAMPPAFRALISYS